MEQRQRKRGVRASREKLEKAMLACGVETQAALAKKIANKEGLDKPPKDLVSKVFREKAVSTLNLTRIANALEVPAHSIYLSSQDKTFDESTEAQNSVQQDPNQTEANHSIAVPSLFIAFIMFASAIAGFVFYDNPDEMPNNPPRVNAPFGKVLILMQAKDPSDPLALALIESYADNQEISLELASASAAFNLSPQQALQQWQSHMVLRFERFSGKYYQIISITAASKDYQAPVLQLFARKREVLDGLQFLTDVLRNQVQRYIEGKELVAQISANNEDMLKYLALKDKMFEDFTPLDYQSSLKIFDELLATNPRSTPFLLGACQLNVYLSWSQHETESLERAATYCQQARFNPQNAHLFSDAQAFLLAHIGKTHEAIALIENQLSSQVPSADTFALLSELYLGLNETSEDNIRQKN